MDTAVRLVGVFVVFVICCVALATCWAASVAALERLRERRDNLVRFRAIREIGRQIYVEGYWFGEHPQTRVALQLLGVALLHGGGFDPDKLREQWRKGDEAEIDHAVLEK